MRGTNTMTLNAETMREAVEYWLNREVLRESVPHVVKSITVPVGPYGTTTHEPDTFTLTIEPLPAPAPESKEEE
jgi:hypothetical protein